jgi:hypothetical protein
MAFACDIPEGMKLLACKSRLLEIHLGIRHAKATSKFLVANIVRQPSFYNVLKENQFC